MSKVQYQEDGANKAYEKLFKENQNRYLLADEVGLGKTVTATRVIAKLWKDNENKNIRIGYICANKALARQNIRKLKERIKEIEPEATIDEKEAEYLSLGFLNLSDNVSDSKISIHTLTPSTTIKVISDGTVEERAYAYSLIVGNGEDEDQFLENVCKGRAIKSYGKFKEKAKKNIKSIDKGLKDNFQKRLNEEWEKKKDGILEKCIKESASKFEYPAINKKYEYFAWKIFRRINNSLKLFSDKGIENKLKELDLDETFENEFQQIKINEDEYFKMIKNISGRKREIYMNSIKEKLLVIYKRYTLISYYEEIKKEINGNSKVSLKILDELIDGCKSDIGNEFKESFTREAINEEVKNDIIEVVKDICCKEYIRLARKCMTFLSVSEMNMDLFIADEIQNYSELFKGKKEKYSEMDMLIQEIIGGNKKLILMSATPFRYHSLLNELENTEKDEDADNNDDDNKILKEEEDKLQRYLESDTDIYNEFKNIIGYLKDGFEFTKWEKKNGAKFEAIKNNNHNEYINCIKAQENMLKGANVSRVERYMSDMDVTFKTVNKEILVDKLLLQELRNIPRTKMDVLETRGNS